MLPLSLDLVMNYNTLSGQQFRNRGGGGSEALASPPGADLGISKGGFFLLLWLAGHSQPHPLSIVFLAKGGFFRTLRTIEEPPPRSASVHVRAFVVKSINSPSTFRVTFIKAIAREDSLGSEALSPPPPPPTN